jgi:hypothetical protein
VVQVAALEAAMVVVVSAVHWVVLEEVLVEVDAEVERAEAATAVVMLEVAARGVGD